MTMLDILKERLVDGLEISKVKEKPSKYEIVFSIGDLTEKSELPKSCAPGRHNHVVDTTIFNAMAAFPSIPPVYIAMMV